MPAKTFAFLVAEVSKNRVLLFYTANYIFTTISTAGIFFNFSANQKEFLFCRFS
jgi:hypothetical protein